jgi:hypothetical protein
VRHDAGVTRYKDMTKLVTSLCTGYYSSLQQQKRQQQQHRSCCSCVFVVVVYILHICEFNTTVFVKIIVVEYKSCSDRILYEHAIDCMGA